MTLYESAPYLNLILTGPMGVGKTTVGRAVARRLMAEEYDVDTEIMKREGQTADEIRQLFGEARLKTLQAEAIRELTLRRHSVIIVSGPAMLDDANRQRLADSGVILCLTCTLNEILRRMHVAHGAWFHNPAHRGAVLSQLKRELRVASLDLPRLDTSMLSIEDTTAAVISFWQENAAI